MAKIKIKVTKLAYYKNHLVYPNEIIEYDGQLPSWATLADGKGRKKEEKESDNAGQVGPDEVKTPENTEGNNDTISDNAGQDEQINAENEQNEPVCEQTESVIEQNGENLNTTEEKSEIELQEELDALLDESVQKGIAIENIESKTLVEQIEEIKNLLGK